jgi:hypothetical protein
MCESHAAYSNGIVFGIGRGLGTRLLLSRSPVDPLSEHTDQSNCRFIVIKACSIVQINITFKCTFSFSFECSFSKCASETQSPVLGAVELPKFTRES